MTAISEPLPTTKNITQIHMMIKRSNKWFDIVHAHPFIGILP